MLITLLGIIAGLFTTKSKLDPDAVPIELEEALAHALEILFNVDIAPPDSIAADIADLQKLIPIIEGLIGKPVAIANLIDVDGALEAYAANVTNVLGGQFVKIAELPLTLGGTTDTFVVGAMLKGGAAYTDLYGS